MKDDLRNKFSSVVQAALAEQKAKEDPSFVFPCLVQTLQPVSDWPDDIKPNTETAKQLYTFRVTFDTLEKIAAMPEVKSLTIR